MFCDQLYTEGIIKQESNGQFVAVENIEEQQEIRSKSKQKKMQEMQQQNELLTQQELEEMSFPNEQLDKLDNMQ